MEKIILMFSSVFLLMISCDNGGVSSSYTPSSSSYSQPSNNTVNCAECNGSGIILNPYDGNYYYCQNCGGTGKKTVSTSGSNPSFTGHGGCTDCSCSKFVGTINDNFCQRSGCGHPWGRHK